MNENLYIVLCDMGNVGFIGQYKDAMDFYQSQMENHTIIMMCEIIYKHINKEGTIDEEKQG